MLYVKCPVHTFPLRYRPCPGLTVHTHPMQRGVKMFTCAGDPEVRVETLGEHGRWLIQYLTRRQAARLLQWWRACNDLPAIAARHAAMPR